MGGLGYSNPNQKPASYVDPATGKLVDWEWDPHRGSWKIVGGNESVPTQLQHAPTSYTPPAAPGTAGFGAPNVRPGSAPNMAYNSMPTGGGLLQGGDQTGGMSTYEKWMLGLGAFGAAAGAYSSYQQGKSQAKTAQQQLDEQKREFNTNGALDTARHLDAAPMRDRAMYLMSQRLGMNPTAFHGETLTQQGSPGGIDPAQMAAANNAYTPGAGGTGGSSEVAKKILAGMGYTYPTPGGPPGTPTPTPPPPPDPRKPSPIQWLNPRV